MYVNYFDWINSFNPFPYVSCFSNFVVLIYLKWKIPCIGRLWPSIFQPADINQCTSPKLIQVSRNGHRIVPVAFTPFKKKILPASGFLYQSTTSFLRNSHVVTCMYTGCCTHYFLVMAIPAWETPGYLSLLCHVFILFLPVTLPYPTHIPPITHLIYDMGYRWDIGGISKGQLRNTVKSVKERW